VSDPRHQDDHVWNEREARRGRLERHADDYVAPSDWDPHARDPRDHGPTLPGLLLAGLVLLMLVVGIYFLLPSREDVLRPFPGGARVPVPEMPRLPDAPRLPDTPDLPRPPV